MAQDEFRSRLSSARLLIIGVVAVIVVFGLALIVMALGSSAPAAEEAQRADALSSSSDECVTCHRRATPGIVEQFGVSTMAAAEVTCRNCHEVEASYPGAVEHEGTHVLPQPTTAMCQPCHTAEVAEYNQSRHALPAYVAYAGTQDLSPEMLDRYESIPEAGAGPIKERNALFALEGPEITRFACRSCHDIGLPQEDGSVGECAKCHLRHEFSRKQARKPETCNACHIGPDHPQFEIYQESPHGIAYATSGGYWNWEADPGTLTVQDFPAATCAI
jgi:hydroxylamine dehydrogenase